MSSPVSSLPEPDVARVVERVFERMRGAYGARFDRQWECPAGMDPVQHADAIKRTWCDALAPLCADLRVVAHGLGSLPAHPPSLPEFVALCRGAPPRFTRYLPPPKMSPQEAAPHVAKARAMKQAIAARAAEAAMRRTAAQGR